MFCPYCGEPMQSASARCPGCGRQLSATASDSVSSSFYANEGAAQAAQLSDTICQALREYGPSILDNPRVLVSYCMDFTPDDDRVGQSFINNCDAEYLQPFVHAMREGTLDALVTASCMATRLLADDRSIVERMARAVSQSVASGLAEYKGLSISFPQDSADSDLRQTEKSANTSVDSAGRDGRVKKRGSSVRSVSRGAIFCNACGARNRQSDVFCGACGRRLHPGPARPAFNSASASARPNVGSSAGSRTGSNVGHNLGSTTSNSGHNTGPNVAPANVSSSNAVTMSSSTGTSHSRMSIIVGVLAFLVMALIAFLVFGPKADGSETGGTWTSGTSVKQEHPAPVFSTAKASSTLPKEGDDHTYEAKQVLDGNRQTCWAEGVGTDKADAWNKGKTTDSESKKIVGVGEWIELEADEMQYVSGIRIMNGYPKLIDESKGADSETYYYHNTRPHEITITLSDGWSTKAFLTDGNPGTWQTVEFDAAHPTTSIRITIDSVYDTKEDGSGRVDWPDTTIDEIEAF